jgi:hypothetical protein
LNHRAHGDGVRVQLIHVFVVQQVVHQWFGFRQALQHGVHKALFEKPKTTQETQKLIKNLRFADSQTVLPRFLSPTRPPSSKFNARLVCSSRFSFFLFDLVKIDVAVDFSDDVVGSDAGRGRFVGSTPARVRTLPLESSSLDEYRSNRRQDVSSSGQEPFHRSSSSYDAFPRRLRPRLRIVVQIRPKTESFSLRKLNHKEVKDNKREFFLMPSPCF